MLTRWICMAAVLGGLLTNAAQARPIRALLVTGGHGFQQKPFFEMFDSYPDFEFIAVTQPEANELYAPYAADMYDVIVYYDMVQEITEEQKQQLLHLIENGKGIVSLHHAIASYEAWPEWIDLLGGHYWLQEGSHHGKPMEKSTYQHDVDMKVTIADPAHPITAGVEDYTIHDEVYGGFWVSPDVHVLLTTDHPQSTEQVGWTNTYGEGRIVYLQGGHDAKAYANESFSTLVYQAIKWASQLEESDQ